MVETHGGHGDAGFDGNEEFADALRRFWPTR